MVTTKRKQSSDIKATTKMGYKRKQLKLSSKQIQVKKQSTQVIEEIYPTLNLENQASTVTGVSEEEHEKKCEEFSKIPPQVVLKVTQVLDNVGSFDFNIFELDELIGKKSLFYISNAIFTAGDMDNLYDRDRWRSFITAISEGYSRDIAYHNDIHAGDVFQTSYVLMNEGKLKERLSLQDVDMFSVLLAAICHDLKHPGYNNGFLVNSRAKLAIRYNGKDAYL